MANTYTGITAGDAARQHNGNVYNTNTNYYTLRQRRSDETLREDRRDGALLKAAAEGQTKRVEYLVQIGADRDYADENGMTALHHAAFSGFADTVQSLLNLGVDVNSFSDSRGTPLCLAALKGREEVVRTLLKARANVHANGGWLGSALHAACFPASLPVMKALLDYGADPNPARSVRDAFLPNFERTNKLDTGQPEWVLSCPVVHILAAERDGQDSVECLNLLLENGANVNAHSQYWETHTWPSPGGKIRTDVTSLMAASMSGNLSNVKLLLLKGALVDAKDSEGTSALHWAAEAGNSDIISVLLENGASFDRKTRKGRTALMLAANSGSSQAIRVLVKAGANVNVPDQTGRTALMTAASSGNAKSAQTLLELGADACLKDANGNTALHLSVKSAVGAIRPLVKAGADVNARTLSNETPLMWAAGFDQIASVKELVSLKADVNCRSRFGMSALGRAEGSHASEIISILFDAGALMFPLSPTQKTSWTSTGTMDKDVSFEALQAAGTPVGPKHNCALLYAASYGTPRIIEYLCEKGADINCQQQSEFGRTPLMLAVLSNSLERVKALTALGANVDIRDTYGSFALLYANVVSNIDIARFLVRDAKVDIDSQDNAGNTLLINAVRSGRTPLVRELIGLGADVRIKNLTGQTPRKYAEGFGAAEIIQLLKEAGG